MPTNSKQLAAAGTVKPDTLVWRDGMADWPPYQQVKAEVEGGSLAPAESPGESAPAASGTPPVDHAQQASADSPAAPVSSRHPKTRRCGAAVEPGSRAPAVAPHPGAVE
ncbi:MAG: GYF domain-containing protein [Verrucomicrobiales bacterium]